MQLFKLSILTCSVSLSLQAFSQDFIYTFSGKVDATIHEKIKGDFQKNSGLQLTEIVCKPERNTGALFFCVESSETNECDLNSISYPLIVKSILIENKLSPKEFFKR